MDNSPKYSLNQAECDEAIRVSIKLNSELRNILENREYESLEIVFVNESDIEIYIDESKFLLQKKDSSEDIYDVCVCSSGPLIGETALLTSSNSVRLLSTSNGRYINKGNAIKSSAETIRHGAGIASPVRESHKSQRVALVEATVVRPPILSSETNKRKSVASAYVSPTTNQPSHSKTTSKKAKSETKAQADSVELDKQSWLSNSTEPSHHIATHSRSASKHTTCNWISASFKSIQPSDTTTTAYLSEDDIRSFFSPIEIRSIYAFPEHSLSLVSNQTENSGSSSGRSDNDRNMGSFLPSKITWFVEFDSRQGLELGLLRDGESINVQMNIDDAATTSPELTRRTTSSTGNNQRATTSSSSSSSSRVHVVTQQRPLVLVELTSLESSWVKAVAIPYSTSYSTSLTGLFLPSSISSNRIELNTLLGSDYRWYCECLQVMTEFLPELYQCGNIQSVIKKYQYDNNTVIPKPELIHSSVSAQLLPRSSSATMYSLCTAPVPGAFVKDADCGSFQHLFRTINPIRTFLQSSSMYSIQSNATTANELNMLIRRLLAVQSSSLLDQTVANIFKCNHITRTTNKSVVDSQTQLDSQTLFELSMQCFLLDQIGRLLILLCTLHASVTSN